MPLPDLNHGALAPLSDEADIADLEVSGTLPTELNGTLIRNGPNPFEGRFDGHDVLSWWPEAAMLHGISVRNGQALGYRNRWARTKNWGSHFRAGNPDSLVDSNPNVNVLGHGGEILALAEGGPPLAITRELETLGPPPGHQSLHSGMTAHPKVDPHSGELVYFRADWSAPFLRYGVISAGGELKRDTVIDLSAPSMMHDMAITATKSILFDLSVAYDFSLLAEGVRIPLRWFDERQSRIGVVPRHEGTVRWFEIEPCFIQHVVNAFDLPDSGKVVVEVVRYPWYLRLDPDGRQFQPNPLGVLWRYEIDPGTATVSESQVDDRAIELPRINETRTGIHNRYLYAVEQPTDAEMRGIIRYDRQQGSIQRHTIDHGDQNSEPVFVPRPGASSEDDGWVLAWVYRHATDTSDLVVLDARDIEAHPLATIHLPRRVPAGFHGAWVPADR